MLRNNHGVHCLDVLDNIHPQPLGFLISKMGVFQANIRENVALNYIIFYYGLYVLKYFSSYRLLSNSRKRFGGRGHCFRILMIDVLLSMLETNVTTLLNSLDLTTS